MTKRPMLAIFPHPADVPGDVAPRMVDVQVVFTRAHRHAGQDYAAGASVMVSLAGAAKLARGGAVEAAA